MRIRPLGHDRAGAAYYDVGCAELLAGDSRYQASTACSADWVLRGHLQDTWIPAFWATFMLRFFGMPIRGGCMMWL